MQKTVPDLLKFYMKPTMDGASPELEKSTWKIDMANAMTWRNSQKYKNQPLPYHRQRTLDFLKKSLFKEKKNKNNLTRGV